MRSLTDLSFDPGVPTTLTARRTRPAPPANLHADVLICDDKGRLSAAQVLSPLGIKEGDLLSASLEADAIVLRPVKRSSPTTTRVDGRLRLSLPAAWRRWLDPGTSTPKLVLVADASNRTITVRSISTLVASA